MLARDEDASLALLISIFENVDPSNLLQVLASHDGDLNEAIVELSTPEQLKPDSNDDRSQKPRQTGLECLKWTKSSERRRKNEAILELHTASQIESILPCTLIRNVLPIALSRSLLEKMLVEAETWTKGYFKLFDRTVSSPHVANFYLRSKEEIAKHNTYVYNGQSISGIRPFNAEMLEAHAIIESRTRDWLRQRGELDQDWTANVAFANLYDGRDSAVGYHSDQLSFLGPIPTIASLSLGCEREFRLKPVANSPTSRTVSIRLPHNSLFIMGPGCQEDYKHSIHPVSSAKGLDLHPIAGAKRINITYRKYRDEFEPSKLPRCRCGQAVLRSAKSQSDRQYTDGDVKGSGKLWNGRKYFWHCDGDKRPGCDGCNYFHWASFTATGSPILDS